MALRYILPFVLLFGAVACNSDGEEGTIPDARGSTSSTAPAQASTAPAQASTTPTLAPATSTSNAAIPTSSSVPSGPTTVLAFEGYAYWPGHRAGARFHISGETVTAFEDLGQVGTLSTEAIESLRDLASALRGVDIPDHFEGRPTDDDFNNTYALELMRDGERSIHTYTETPPADLADLHEFLWTVIGPLAACESTEWMTADSGCSYLVVD